MVRTKHCCILKNSILDKKQKLLTERALLLETLTAANSAIADDSEERQLVADMVKLAVDNSNQPDGITASSDVRKKVRDAHKEIDEKSKSLYKYRNNGLTINELARLSYLLKVEADGTITSAEIVEKRIYPINN